MRSIASVQDDAWAGLFVANRIQTAKWPIPCNTDVQPRDRTGFIPLARSDPYEPSSNGKIRCTLVPWLPLFRSTWPPSCWAKPSTRRPPSPEPAR